MKNTLLIIVLAGVVAATIGVGLLHGQMTLRWGAGSDMVAAAEKLEQLPESCGDWQLQSSQELSDSVRKMLRCEGNISRQYVNQKTGERVDVGIVFGPPGGISEHTPEVCVSSRDFTQLGEREKVRIDRVVDSGGEPVEDEVWYVDFEKNGPSSRNMRVYWAWSTGERWIAPDSPKGVFAGAAHLYKIQVSSLSLPGSLGKVSEAPDDSCGRFLKDFMPVAQGYLVPADGEARRE